MGRMNSCSRSNSNKHIFSDDDTELAIQYCLTKIDAERNRMRYDMKEMRKKWQSNNCVPMNRLDYTDAVGNKEQLRHEWDRVFHVKKEPATYALHTQHAHKTNKKMIIYNPDDSGGKNILTWFSFYIASSEFIPVAVALSPSLFVLMVIRIENTQNHCRSI